MTSALPLRHPDTSSQEFMTRRAWWLLGANTLIPGAAQVLAGSRRFGRFMLRLWLLGAALLVLLVLLALFFRAPLLYLGTTTLGLTLLSLIVLFFLACWVVSALDALRLVRLIKLDPLARPLVGIVGVVLLFLPAVFGVASVNVTTQVQQTVAALFGGAKGGIELPSDGRINILLLGGDRGEDREGLRPDSISVMSFDVLTGRSVTIGIPRALEDFPFAEGPMRELYPEGYGVDGCEVDVCYLNSVYTEAQQVHAELYPDAVAEGSEPGIEATREAVEGITGLQIHYYVLVDMAGFAGLIDALGGVDLLVTERVGLGTNDDGSPGWEPPSYWIEPGQQHMDGEIALWYARSRYDTTDFARMERQRQLQAAIVAAATPANLLARLGPVLDAAEQLVESDMPQGMAGLVADLLLRSRGQQNATVELPQITEQGDPDIALIQQAIQDAIHAEPQADG